MFLTELPACRSPEGTDAVQPLWQGEGVYPGETYDHNAFRKVYSDHHPVLFRRNLAQDDDSRRTAGRLFHRTIARPLRPDVLLL